MAKAGAVLDWFKDTHLGAVLAMLVERQLLYDNVFYVDANSAVGGETRDGSRESPFETIEDAVAAANEYTTIICTDSRSGPAAVGFDEDSSDNGVLIDTNYLTIVGCRLVRDSKLGHIRVTNSRKSGANSTADHVFAGSGRGIAIVGFDILLPALNADEQCIYLTGDEVSIIDCNLINPVGKPGYRGIHLTGNNCHIKECRIRLFNDDGIRLNGCTMARVEDVVVSLCSNTSGVHLLTGTLGCIFNNTKLFANAAGILIDSGATYNHFTNTGFHGNSKNWINDAGVTNALISGHVESQIEAGHTLEEDLKKIYDAVSRGTGFGGAPDEGWQKKIEEDLHKIYEVAVGGLGTGTALGAGWQKKIEEDLSRIHEAVSKETASGTAIDETWQKKVEEELTSIREAVNRGAMPGAAVDEIGQKKLEEELGKIYEAISRGTMPGVAEVDQTGQRRLEEELGKIYEAINRGPVSGGAVDETWQNKVDEDLQKIYEAVKGGLGGGAVFDESVTKTVEGELGKVREAINQRLTYNTTVEENRQKWLQDELTKIYEAVDKGAAPGSAVDESWHHKIEEDLHKIYEAVVSGLGTTGGTVDEVWKKKLEDDIDNVLETVREISRPSVSLDELGKSTLEEGLKELRDALRLGFRPSIYLYESWQDETGINRAVWTPTSSVAALAKSAASSNGSMKRRFAPITSVFKGSRGNGHEPNTTWSVGVSGSYLRAITELQSNQTSRLVSNHRWVAAPEIYGKNTILKKLILEFEMRIAGIENLDEAATFLGLTTHPHSNRGSIDIISWGISSDSLQTITDFVGAEITNIGFSEKLNEWNKLKIEVFSGHVKFYVNEEEVAEHAKNLPDGPFYINFFIDTNGDGGTSTLELGIIRCWTEDIA
jgi:hypothetical protein